MKSGKKHSALSLYIIGFIVFFISSAFLIASVYFIDNTAIPTANGVYRAKLFTYRLQGKKFLNPDHSFYINHALYEDFVIYLWKLTGIHNWQGTILTKMAIANSIFAAVTITALFFILWEITKNTRISLLISTLYLFSAFFLFLSISSEDIMPAVAFFFLSIWMLIISQVNRKIWAVSLSAFMFGITVLLHRSFIIGIPAFILSFLLNNRQTSTIATKIQQIVLFSISFFISFTILTYKPLTILFTSPEISGWTGFSVEKIAFTAISGIGQSLVYGENITMLSKMFEPKNLAVEIPTIFFVVFIVVCLIRIAQKKYRFGFLAVFLLSNFIISELVNLRLQGQDPQFQMQPLVIIPLGVGMIYAHKKRKNAKKMWQLFIVATVFTLIIVNTNKALLARGKDTQEIKYFTSIAKHVDLKQTIFLTHRFDSFKSWGAFVWNIDDPNRIVIGLTSYPVDYPQLNTKKTVEKLLSDLENAEKQGKQIVTTDILTLSNNTLTSVFATINASDKAIAMKEAILARYDLKLLLKTTKGPLYLLKPKT